MEIACDLGIEEEVDKILGAFDMPEDEFYSKYGKGGLDGLLS